MTSQPSLFRRANRELHAMPLRLRLSALLVALLAIALLVTGAAATAQVRVFLTQRQDAELRAAALPLATGAIDSNGTAIPTYSYVPTNTYSVQLQDATGNVLYSDANRGQPGGLRPKLPRLSINSPQVRSGKIFSVGSTHGGTRWHVITGLAPGTSDQTYAVAVSMQHTDDIVRHLELVILSVGLLALLACAVLGWFAVRRTLRPLRQIEDTARSIAEGDLTRRVPAGGAQDEVGSLSKSLNVMLSRIEDSFAVRQASEEKMRQFVADASHELRTPLATVRGYAELFRQGAVSRPEDIRSSMRRIEDEATRMAVMVDDLLLLTRLDRRHADAEKAEMQFAPVDLTIFAADVVQDAKAIDHNRAVTLRGLDGAVRPTPVLGSEAGLRQVITNLMANAIRYTPARSPIEVLVGTADGCGQVHIRDHGDGVPEKLRSRIFERFYRADASRNSAHGGSGLGLAIVAAIVEAHHGSAHVQETPGGGATFVLKIPTLPADQDDELATGAQEVHSDGEAVQQSGTVD
ncbi:sensor histidine kinase [Rudaeicoccus suwonensis]|uniref:histidine kinase n=1 Tax=Rudaeicoccus suwonensis TaxID=657409 RepID=A0A561E7U4_9MICO|nr:HAMP domain-containing sensor histidine kinase [Rudaeicoccus suwonensis]TWE11682.1 two-component system OmpR family sensor kinase [Rudaeicoccus suwonensis]